MGPEVVARFLIRAAYRSGRGGGLELVGLHGLEARLGLIRLRETRLGHIRLGLVWLALVWLALVWRVRLVGHRRRVLVGHERLLGCGVPGPAVGTRSDGGCGVSPLGREASPRHAEVGVSPPPQASRLAAVVSPPVAVRLAEAGAPGLAPGLVEALVPLGGTGRLRFLRLGC
jgi:hypothetical protein